MSMSSYGPCFTLFFTLQDGSLGQQGQEESLLADLQGREEAGAQSVLQLLAQVLTQSELLLTLLLWSGTRQSRRWSANAKINVADVKTRVRNQSSSSSPAIL